MCGEKTVFRGCGVAVDDARAEEVDDGSDEEPSENAMRDCWGGTVDLGSSRSTKEMVEISCPCEGAAEGDDTLPPVTEEFWCSVSRRVLLI